MQPHCHTPYYSVDGLLAPMSASHRHEAITQLPHPTPAYWHTGHHYGRYKHIRYCYGISSIIEDPSRITHLLAE